MPGYTAPVPARFFTLPDGRQSSIQMIVGPDGTPRPAAVKTPQQFSEWQQIQDAAPPTAVERDTRRAVAMARPVTDPSKTDDPTAPGWLDRRKTEVAWQNAEEEAKRRVLARPPATDREWHDRAMACVRIAESLGMSLVWVPVTDALGNPPHFELRGGEFGWWGADQIPQMEDDLRRMRDRRADRDAEIEAWREYQERLAREHAEAIARQPAYKLAVLEAERERDRERLARLEAALAERENTDASA